MNKRGLGVIGIVVVVVAILVGVIGYNIVKDNGVGLAPAPGPNVTRNSHLDCNAQQQCVLVQGRGPNLCNSNADCNVTIPPQTHLGCDLLQCMTLPGPGPDTCTNDVDCNSSEHHLECNGNQCAIFLGPGINECLNHDDCLNSTNNNTHLECNFGAGLCEIVAGAGANLDGCGFAGQLCNVTNSSAGTPDLIIAPFLISNQSGTSPNASITLTSRVYNIGTDFAGPSTTLFTVIPAPPGGSQLIFTSGLSPGEFVDVSANFTGLVALPNGSNYIAGSMADQNNVVVESNENNNDVSGNFVII